MPKMHNGAKFTSVCSLWSLRKISVNSVTNVLPI